MPDEPINTGIYAITNIVNGKVYIGSAIRLNVRLIDHKRNLSKNKHGNRKLQCGWNKYGESAFIFSPILFCDKSFLIQWEQIVIDGHISAIGWNNMYNIARVAGSNLGVKRSKESRAKQSISNKNRKVSAETCARISEGVIASLQRRRQSAIENGDPDSWLSKSSRYRHGSGSRGKTRTPEHIANHSSAMKGRSKPPRSQEYRDNISKAQLLRYATQPKRKHTPEEIEKRANANRGRKRTQEQIDRMKIAASKRDYKNVSQQTIDKIRTSLTGRVASPETRKKLSEERKLRWSSLEYIQKMKAIHDSPSYREKIRASALNRARADSI